MASGAISLTDGLSQIGQTQTSEEGLVDVDSMPIKRGQRSGTGAVNNKRLKSRHDKCAKTKIPRTCMLCREPGHQFPGNCERRKEFGSMVAVGDIDQLVNNLTWRNSPDFNPVVEIRVGSDVFQQVHPQTNCMHFLNYAVLQTCDSGKDNTREGTRFLCVTQIFARV